MYTLKALPEFEAWLAGLTDKLVRDTVVKRLTRVELGLLGDARSVGDGVSELKIDLGAGWRIYYTRRGKQIIFLLTGGSKRSQDQDIARAKSLAATLKNEVFHAKSDKQSGSKQHSS